MERYGGSKTGSRSSGVNKVFLLNTVHGLKSHNKREEEEDCWRQHALDHRAQGRGRPSNTSPPRRREPTESGDRRVTDTSDADARRFWAEQKERAMAATTPSVDTAPAGVVSVTESSDRRKSRKRARLDESPSGSSSSDGDGERKKRKEGAKKKKKKTKKQKKKEKKREGKKKKRGLENRDSDGGGGSGESEAGDGGEGSSSGSDDDSERRRAKSKRRAEKKRKKRRR